MQQHGNKYFALRTPLYPHPPNLVVGSIGLNSTFFNMAMLPYKLKGIEYNASTYSLLTHILNLWVGLKGKKKYLHVVMLFIKLRGKKYRLTQKQTL